MDPLWENQRTGSRDVSVLVLSPNAPGQEGQRPPAPTCPHLGPESGHLGVHTQQLWGGELGRMPLVFLTENLLLAPHFLPPDQPLPSRGPPRDDCTRRRSRFPGLQAFRVTGHHVWDSCSPGSPLHPLLQDLGRAEPCHGDYETHRAMQRT